MGTVQRAGVAALVFSAALIVSACTGNKDTSSDPEASAKPANPVVVIKTNLGEIEVELFPDKAPATVENFLSYVDAEFYNGTIFHRVIPEFMIQGGGFDTDHKKKPTREPLKNEADNGLKNEEGTIAMARTNIPDSATSQFFINVADNAFLDFKSPTPQGYGYAVFGRVVSGMDVVKKIENTPTADGGGAFRNLPKEAVIIESVVRKPESP
ncbi:MAG: peptidylprolyl isomerase [Candidatus Binatia bacterium]